MKREPVVDCPQPETPFKPVCYGEPTWTQSAAKHPDGSSADWRTARNREPQGEPENWHAVLLYLGISGWVVLTIILGIMALAKAGWLP